MHDDHHHNTAVDNLIALLGVEVDRQKLRENLRAYHPADIAEALEDLSGAEQETILTLLEIEQKADVLEEASERDIENFVEDSPVDAIAEVVNAMPPDEAVDILEHVETAKVDAVIAKLDPAHQRDVQALRRYAPETAGGIMTNEYVRARPSDTAAEILTRLKTKDDDVETVSDIFIVTEENILRGVLSVEDVLAAAADATAESLMDPATVTVPPTTDQEICARLMQKYDLPVLPVVDANWRMVGMITVDDILEVMEDEASEDMYRLAGVGADDPLRASIFVRAYKRLPWLAITLLGSGIVAPYLLEHYFHETLIQVVGLMLFIPAVMGISGNSGIQAATVTVRGLATGDIDARDTWAHLRREVGLAIVVGIICAGAIWLCTYGVIFSVDGAMAREGQLLTFASIVAVSLFAGVLGSVLLGTIVPLLCVRIKVDPAVASGPFVTTLVDIGAQLIYFGLATALLLNR